MALTAAQVWYVARVYPERVSASEASDQVNRTVAIVVWTVAIILVVMIVASNYVGLP